MKLKNLVKKGGVADIVTLMVIVGLVIALIIAVVLPMIKTASKTGRDNDMQVDGINNFIDSLGNGATGDNLNYSIGESQYNLDE